MEDRDERRARAVQGDVAAVDGDGDGLVRTLGQRRGGRGEREAGPFEALSPVPAALVAFTALLLVGSEDVLDLPRDHAELQEKSVPLWKVERVEVLEHSQEVVVDIPGPLGERNGVELGVRLADDEGARPPATQASRMTACAWEET